MDMIEAVRLIKFDGEDANKALLWWRRRAVRGIRSLAAIKATKGKNAICKANDKAYQLLIMSWSGMAFGLINRLRQRSPAMVIHSRPGQLEQTCTLHMQHLISFRSLLASTNAVWRATSTIKMKDSYNWTYYATGWWLSIPPFDHR